MSDLLPRDDRVGEVSWGAALHHLAVAALAATLPAVLWRWHTPLIGSTGGSRYLAMELFGLTGALAIAWLLWRRLRQLPGAGMAELAPVILPALVAALFLTQVSEHSLRSPDYRCYQSAARAIAAGESPYDLRDLYRYPPGPGIVQVEVTQAVVALAARAGVAEPVPLAEDAVFYLYQCGQLLALMLAWLLLARLGRELGLDPLTAALVVSLLLVVDNPVFRTLKHNQVNIWLLDLWLLALLWLPRRPGAAGLAAALGAHLKLYPLGLIGAWVLMRRGRAVLGAAVGLVGVVAVTWGMGYGWLWRDFVHSAGGLPGGINLRDNGLHAVAYNVIKLIARPAEPPPPAFVDHVDAVYAALSLVAVLWFVARFARRERAWARTEQLPAWRETAYRLHGHGVDSVALMLLISPVVWEHHYLMALPLALLAFAAAGRERPWQVGAGWALALVVPTFDVFPLSYHRLAGLLLLLHATDPARVRPDWSAPRWVLAAAPAERADREDRDGLAAS